MRSDISGRRSVVDREIRRHSPVSNEWQYCRMEVRRDLFGGAAGAAVGADRDGGAEGLTRIPIQGAAQNGVLLDKIIVARTGRIVQSAVDGGNGRLYGTHRYHAHGLCEPVWMLWLWEHPAL